MICPKERYSAFFRFLNTKKYIQLDRDDKLRFSGIHDFRSLPSHETSRPIYYSDKSLFIINTFTVNNAIK